MINLEERMDIKQLYREGHSIKEIVRLSGRSRNTVRKVLRDNYREDKKRKDKKSILDEYKIYIENKFKDGRPVCRILQDLAKMGYEGSASQVYRFLQPFRDEVKRKDKLTVRFETAPGEQAQVDWGHCGQFIDQDGHKRKLYVFAYVLSYSRACYVEFTTSMNLAVLVKCHQNAFDYFGGVPEKILYDNMKTVKLSPFQLNPAFVDFAEYYGFAVKTCRPYRARTKGKVERLIRYFRDNFLPEKVFDSFEDANAQIHHWMEYEANSRVHGTTKERPCDLLPAESLNDHRQVLPYQLINKVTRKANSEGYVSYQANRYSVPIKAAGKTIELEHVGTTIRIRLQDMIVTEHEQASGKGKTMIHQEHISDMWKLTLANSENPQKSKDLIQFNRDVQVRELSTYEALCQ